MAVPASRTELKDYCLRRLGYPVIDINVSNEQIDDRIDDALQYYRDYHFDGSERTFYRHSVTQADKDNKYITLPDGFMGVSDILDIGDSSVGSNTLFNLRYQIHMNDLYDISSSNMTPYVMAMRHIENIEEIFVGKQLFRFNQHINQLHIDMDWENDIDLGNYVIIDGYKVVDPDTYSAVWGDRWLLRYTTALIKKQWGENVSKFANMQLPGGVMLDGVRILQDAQSEIDKLEEEMIGSYSLPVSDMTG